VIATKWIHVISADLSVICIVVSISHPVAKVQPGDEKSGIAQFVLAQKDFQHSLVLRGAHQFWQTRKDHQMGSATVPYWG